MSRPPVWFTLLVILLTVPAFGFPYMLSALPGGEDASAMRALVWVYPFYMLLSGWLAYRSYTVRQYVAWMLVAVMILSTVAIYWLVTTFFSTFAV